MPLLTQPKPNKPIVFFLRSEMFYHIVTDHFYMEMSNVISDYTKLEGTINKITIDYKKNEPTIDIEFLTANHGIVDVIIGVSDTIPY